ncbi:hypothetical protein P43SY_010300 [Pythium insidiosum]|uniref:Dual specificity phosphatase catalytic domain-containing protein n=1 Tax=Pythium insidiosum TaxID=114742 RepID=A0AAD5Q0P8_PYTIN|nr:hypothetical protein P43SY_010300 [Pythium insidiosum]
MSRSVSMVMAYLMQNHSMGYDDALALVKRQRPVAQPNAGFEAQLRAFAERVSRSLQGPVAIGPAPPSTQTVRVRSESDTVGPSHKRQRVDGRDK